MQEWRRSFPAYCNTTAAAGSEIILNPAAVFHS